MIASIVAAAPMVWPIAGLMEFTGTGRRAPPEHPSDHRALDGIVERGGRAVRAHEIDLVRADTGLAEGRAHCGFQPAAMGMGRRDVTAVADGSVAQDVAEGTGPGLRLPPEQHEGGRLSEEETTARAIEGADAVAREGAQHVEAAHDEPAKDVIPPATTASAWPWRRRSAAIPIAVPPAAHAVAAVSTGPWAPSQRARFRAGASYSAARSRSAGRSPSSARSPSSTPRAPSRARRPLDGDPGAGADRRPARTPRRPRRRGGAWPGSRVRRASRRCARAS